jgi:hypothetical protein
MIVNRDVSNDYRERDREEEVLAWWSRLCMGKWHGYYDHFSGLVYSRNAGVARSQSGSAQLASHIIAPPTPSPRVQFRAGAWQYPPAQGNRSPAEARRGQARGETGPARADHELARTGAASDHTSHPGPTSQSDNTAGPAGAGGVVSRWRPIEPNSSTTGGAPSSNHRSPGDQSGSTSGFLCPSSMD